MVAMEARWQYLPEQQVGSVRALSEGEREPRELVVVKFGSRSVGSPDTIARAASIISRATTEGMAPIMVVPAMAGVPRQLTALAESLDSRDELSRRRLLREVQETHNNTVHDLQLDPRRRAYLKEELGALYDELGQEVKSSGKLTDKKKDAIMRFGGRLNARQIAWVLEQQDITAMPVDAHNFLMPSSGFGEVSVDMPRSLPLAQRALGKVLDADSTPVVSELVARNRRGEITPLADLTATAIARLISAPKVIFYTDVPGVFISDPRKDSAARPKTSMTLEEADTMFKAGYGEIYSRAIEPLLGTSTELIVKSSLQPELSGTTISTDYSSIHRSETVFTRRPRVS